MLVSGRVKVSLIFCCLCFFEFCWNHFGPLIWHLSLNHMVFVPTSYPTHKMGRYYNYQWSSKPYKVGPYDRYKWSFNLYRMASKKWVTGVISPYLWELAHPISNCIRGPPCTNGLINSCTTVFFSFVPPKKWSSILPPYFLPPWDQHNLHREIGLWQKGSWIVFLCHQFSVRRLLLVLGIEIYIYIDIT